MGRRVGRWVEVAVVTWEVEVGRQVEYLGFGDRFNGQKLQATFRSIYILLFKK